MQDWFDCMAWMAMHAWTSDGQEDAKSTASLRPKEAVGATTGGETLESRGHRAARVLFWKVDGELLQVKIRVDPKQAYDVPRAAAWEAGWAATSGGVRCDGDVDDDVDDEDFDDAKELIMKRTFGDLHALLHGAELFDGHEAFNGFILELNVEKLTHARPTDHSWGSQSSPEGERIGGFRPRQ